MQKIDIERSKMKNKKKFLRTSISALVVVATVLISVVATIKYKEDYDEEKRFNYIRENVEKSSEEKISKEYRL